MSLISEKLQKNKLKKYNINIKTKYIVGNKILERNTDDSYNDDINNGVRCEKEYFIGNKKIHTEKLFDTRIEYTFITKEQENNDYICPNCGMKDKLKNFIDGCKYCGTYYNIDYKNKDLGSKYHYDRVLKSNKYKIITAIIDLIISLIISYIFIKLTSRTFNNYDVSKILIYGLILSLIAYYFFYSIDAYIILSPIKKYKDKQNKKQIEFWNKTQIDKKTFFNNLNYEIRKKYYKNEFIIDYDIMDFTDFKTFKKQENIFVEIKAEVRIIYYKNNRIISKEIKDTYLMKRINDSLELKDGTNIMKCHNCGASIDVTKDKCEYCDTPIKYLQNWIME